MIKGDRVWRMLDEDMETHKNMRVRQAVGTVERASPAGYIRVKWDSGAVENFRPGTDVLRVVTGDDALPRHDWAETLHDIDPPCLACGVIQSDDNEFEACKS